MMMMKTWLWIMCLMWAGMSLNAADFNLYGGKPQSITLRILAPAGRFSPGLDRLLFPHPDEKSAIAVDESNIYKVTPK